MINVAGVNYLAYVFVILWIFAMLVVGIGYCMNTIKNYMDRKNKEENEWSQELMNMEYNILR